MSLIESVKEKAKSLITNTAGMLNTILEGMLCCLVGGAMYVLTYIFCGQMMMVAYGITGLPACVTAGMGAGMGMLLAGLQVMGIVFFVVGLVVVVRALLSIYAVPGGGNGGGY